MSYEELAKKAGTEILKIKDPQTAMAIAKVVDVLASEIGRLGDEIQRIKDGKPTPPDD